MNCLKLFVLLTKGIFVLCTHCKQKIPTSTPSTTPINHTKSCYVLSYITFTLLLLILLFFMHILIIKTLYWKTLICQVGVCSVQCPMSCQWQNVANIMRNREWVTYNLRKCWLMIPFIPNCSTIKTRFSILHEIHLKNHKNTHPSVLFTLICKEKYNKRHEIGVRSTFVKENEKWETWPI